MIHQVCGGRRGHCVLLFRSLASYRLGRYRIVVIAASVPHIITEKYAWPKKAQEFQIKTNKYAIKYRKYYDNVVGDEVEWLWWFGMVFFFLDVVDTWISKVSFWGWQDVSAFEMRQKRSFYIINSRKIERGQGLWKRGFYCEGIV